MRPQPDSSIASDSRPHEATSSGLNGLNVGLLCDDPSLPEALMAYRAAADLGAHVSLVRPCFSEQQDEKSLHDVAHLLGRLYDLLVCVELAPEIVDMLRVVSGVPVVGDRDLGAVDPARESPDPSGIGATPDDVWTAAGSQRTVQWEKVLMDRMG